MKVLYIGVYRDGTGWSQAALDYILALDAAGVNVVPRAMKLNNANPDIPDRVKELEGNDPSNPDVVIQHVLPHDMDYCGKIPLNVGLYVGETTSVKQTSWGERLSRMDIIVTPNELLQRNVPDIMNVYDKPCHMIPHACDVTKYTKTYPVHFKKIHDLFKNKFVFYFIGEVTRRKNLPALLKAFHTEFGPNDDVELLIKGNLSGTTPEQCRQYISKMCEEIKLGLKKYSDISFYKPEYIITDRLTDSQLMSLHMLCDCFVMPSYGEGWCIPAFDAMGFGKPVVYTEETGMATYLGPCGPTSVNRPPGYVHSHKYPVNFGGYGVKSRTQPIFGMQQFTFSDLYTADDNWEEIDILDLRKQMRKAYEDKEDYQQRSEWGMQNVYKFSYEIVGEHFKQVLEDALK